MKLQAWWRLAFAAALVATTWLMLTPSPPSTSGEALPGYDKLAHAAIFASLALLASRAFASRAGAQTFVALVGYATLIEIVQPLAGRAAEALDVVAGAVGAAVTFFLPHERQR